MKRRYDLKPSKPIDLGYDTSFKKPFFASLPPLVDLTSLCSPVQDQGSAGSCTAHAVSGMLEFLELQDFRKGLTMQVEEFAGKGLQHPSRLFIYYNERLIEGTVDQDAGASISDSVQSVVKYGFCNENLWGYDLNNLLVAPHQDSYLQASKHHASKYRKLGLYDMQPCLASGSPFIIGFQVYSSFESQYVAATGNVPMPQWGEQLMGGHAVLVVGYDDPNQQFICKNSWGLGWGRNGYFRLPYAYMANPQLANDFWTIIQ